jgi:cell division inhibitor SulA
MNATARAEQLRRRAAELRALAEAIETSPVMHLEHLAGDDTWRGGRPTLCRTLLATNLHQLHQAADDLRWQAWLFEQRAVELEVIAAQQLQARHHPYGRVG